MKLTPQRLTLTTVIVLAVALFGLVAWQRLAPQPAAAAFTGDFDLENQPLLGDPDAPATIVAFEDFKCPVCKAFEDDAYPRIVNELVETGQAKLYFMNYQFLGPDSTTAGIAGECALAQDEADLAGERDAVGGDGDEQVVLEQPPGRRASGRGRG